MGWPIFSRRGQTRRSAPTRWLFGALLLILALLPSVVARAQEVNHAGLVVLHGDGRLTYAYVAFSEEAITGVELLRRSGIPLVTVSFGGLGEGVCSIDREGCPTSECRQRVCQGRGDESPFWQYFRQAAPGDWRPLTLGASQTKVRDGDLDGWSWTPKEPNLPALTLDEVARLAGVPSGAATSVDPLPTAAVRDIYPSGVEPPDEEGNQGAMVYIGAGVFLLGMSGLVLLILQRTRAVGGAP